MKRRNKTGFLAANVVELLRRTPKNFKGVRKHIIKHGGIPRGLRRAISSGQFKSELVGVL